MSGGCFAIVGQQGSGKSTSVKSLLTQAGGEMYIYDINGEYLQFNNGAKGVTDFNEFLQLVKDKSNSIIVFEEATVHITKRKAFEVVRKLLVGKRHENNIILFVFHNVYSISNEILQLIDFVVLHKTKDRLEYINNVWRHTPENVEIFLQVKASPDPYFSLQLNNEQ